MPGSIRRRGPNSSQLRVYAGIDASSGRKRWVTRTVRGSEREARRQLKGFLEDANNARVHAGSVGDLLDRWFAAASSDWAASTIRETKSLVEHHLKPHLGHLAVAKLTTADIDDFYAHLRRSGGSEGRSLAPGTVHRVHVVLHRALAQAVPWEWTWVNPATDASPTISRLTVHRERAGDASVNPDRFVFSSRDDGSRPWLPNWVTKAFIRCRRDAGLPHFRLHDLRHSMATEMLNDGVPIAVVSNRLAHARASTTLNVYAHAVPGGDEASAERLTTRLVEDRER